MRMFKNFFSLKAIIFFIILAFYASFALVKISLPMADNDAGLYISDGKIIWETHRVFRTNVYSYTVPDYPVYDHHWLSSVTFYLTHRVFGFDGLTILKVTVLLTAFTIFFLAVRKKADFWLIAVFALPTILILSQRTRIRPEMFSYVFIALFLYLLFDAEQHPKSYKIFWLIPLQMLWINFHIFFFVGFGLVGGFLFEKIILNFKHLRSDPLIRKLLIIFLLLFGACLMNPNGIEGALAPLRSHTYETFAVSENQPLFNFRASLSSWNIFSSPFVLMVLTFLASFIFGFRKKQKPIFFLIAGVGSAFAGFIHVRLVVLFAFIFLPAVSSNLNDIYFKIRNWIGVWRPAIAKKIGYIFAGLVMIAYPYKGYAINASAVSQGYPTDWGIGLDLRSNDAGTFFVENGIRGPIFNDYDIGGYILYHVYPRERVFVDNNGADSYPVSFFDDIFMPALSSDDTWYPVQEKYNINSIFISLRDGSPAVGSFLWRRLRDPAWALVYVDTHAIILVKNNSQNKGIIQKFLITPENAKDKLAHMIQSSDVIDRIVAGRALYLLGREDLSTSVFKKIVAQYPKNGWAWLYMGSVKSLANNPASLVSAIVFLENAINVGEKTSESYTWLGLAYFKFGYFEKAEKALREALRLDPGRYDATNYLAQLQSHLGQ